MTTNDSCDRFDEVDKLVRCNKLYFTRWVDVSAANLTKKLVVFGSYAMRQLDLVIAQNFGYRIIVMSKKISLHPKHPERICWGCDKYCPADSLSCGNGSERALHPIELFGEDWLDWGLDGEKKPPETSDS